MSKLGQGVVLAVRGPEENPVGKNLKKPLSLDLLCMVFKDTKVATKYRNKHLASLVPLDVVESPRKSWESTEKDWQSVLPT